MQKFRPLLAASLKHEEISKCVPFPVLASPKLDGIRVIIKNGKVLTRSLKPVPNRYVQSVLGCNELNGMDGEIIVGEPTNNHVFRQTTSAIRKEDGYPSFHFFVFDNFLLEGSFKTRYEQLINSQSEFFTQRRATILRHILLTNEKELIKYEDDCLRNGFEGVMVRSIDGNYKQGRSTLKEGILLKLKRFQHSEAKIIGFVERLHNANEAKENALGLTERSSHQENKIGKGDLGALIVRCLETGLEFNIGTGFTDEERLKIWKDKDTLLGEIIKYKFMDYGEYEVPRFPVYEGFRMAEDM
jgi:DNA ligase-1